MAGVLPALALTLAERITLEEAAFAETSETINLEMVAELASEHHNDCACYGGFASRCQDMCINRGCNCWKGPGTCPGGNLYCHPGCKPLCSEVSWPAFETESDLQGSSWATYMRSLYGELPSSYPVKLSEFWCFYTDKMAAAQVKSPASVGTCPTGKDAPDGQRYDENNAYSSKDLTWLWHSPDASVFPKSGFGSNSIVEVSHQKDPFGDEHHGMWFVYAKGSGVFLDLGKTKVFNDHSDAYDFFQSGNDNQKMCQAAAAQGYDSVQFVKHRDSTNYPCAKQIDVDWMNVEIVAVRLVGTYSCGQAQGTASALRAGWGGDKPCKCDPNNPNTNCVFS